MNIASVIHESVWRIACNLRRRAIASGRGGDAVTRDFPFLAGYLAEIQSSLPEDLTWEASLEWFAAQALEGPLADLCSSRACGVAVALTGLVDEDARFAHLYASLHGPAAVRRPTLNLLRELLETSSWEPIRTLIDAGVLEVINTDAPRSEWAVRVPGALWSAIRGEPEAEPAPGLRYTHASELAEVDDLLLPDVERARLSAVRSLFTQPGRVLLIRGLPGSDRIKVAGAIARLLDRGVLVAENVTADAARAIGPLCSATRAVPVFLADLTAGEAFELPRLRTYNGSAIVVMGREGGLATDTSHHALTYEIPIALAAERAWHWERALNGHAPADLPELAETFTMQPAYIRRSAPLAIDHATLDGRMSVEARDVRRAARAINRQILDPLAAYLPDGGGWDNLVAGPHTMRELRNLESRCRHREQLAGTRGPEFPGGLNRGVRALFEGPSGTGKTLAARVLAAGLNIDVHRVDLASVVNKYIGETEKNLSRILSRAEDLDIVLLLDEGDSLMSRRTDVRSANDRYANLETNYLLQRLETYTGMVIITTNAAGAIDNAFRRRFDCVVKFQTPGPAERLQLWMLHLPRRHSLSFEALEQIAMRYTLTGGQIRNAAVQASLLALGGGSEELAEADISEAIQVEYRKAGASLPTREPPPDSQPRESLAMFLSSIS